MERPVTEQQYQQALTFAFGAIELWKQCKTHKPDEEQAEVMLRARDQERAARKILDALVQGDEYKKPGC